jgi:hypothetical protein
MVVYDDANWIHLAHDLRNVVADMLVSENAGNLWNNSATASFSKWALF